MCNLHGSCLHFTLDEALELLLFFFTFNLSESEVNQINILKSTSSSVKRQNIPSDKPGF